MSPRALLLALALIPAPAAATLSEGDLARAVARPPASASLPARLVFTDQWGQRTTLGAVAQGRPLVLIFADFTCRHVCAPGLTIASGALAATGLVPGRDYGLAVVGIDPRDTGADARHLAGGIAPASLARATTLLAGDAASVRAATRDLGYGYVYDADNDQFAHDAAVYVFGSDGRLASLLPELALQPTVLKAALRGGTPPVHESYVQRVAHLCYGFAAAHGRFGRPVVIGLQALSLLLLAATALLFWRRRTA